MTIDNEDDILQDTFDRLYKTIVELMVRDKIDPQIVAATLASHALKLYKQILTEEDYLKMLESIHYSGKLLIDGDMNKTIN